MSAAPQLVAIGLGSNLGDREAAIGRALDRLEARASGPWRRSALYETEPVGGPPQGLFLNAAAVTESALSPEALLEACLAIERELGRVRTVRDGPRTIDVDLLLCGSLTLNTAALTLPHPRLHERRFVLEPLAEIAADALHPVFGATIGALLARCPDRSRVERFAAAGRRA